MMSEQGWRSTCAVIGLALGMLLMVLVGRGGMVAGAIYGASGAVLGGMVGEQIARRRG